ncbi:terpene cyclase [Nonomuraea longispora]|uniref:Terpene synthase n=1 Tax=Nonomuraea longispora TaxID=1848320 RepID=A0A4R4MXZ4_9ACTN|nr:terpene cyclase [Nonomuraea longispora]TDC01148.1 terpene cyclase [Nonomuraea longispora]
MVENHVPQILSLFPCEVNAHVEHAREHLRAWVHHTGLVHKESSKERFDRADFGWFAAMVYPTADAARLALLADWFGWLFLVDDQLDDGEVGRRPEQMMEVFTEIHAVMTSPDLGQAIARRPGVPVVVSSLADLWRRTADGASPRWQRRFAEHLVDCLTTAATWEAGNRVTGTVPDEATYIINRRHIGAIYVCMDLIEIVAELDVPTEIYDSPQFIATLDAACNVVCWTNDVYSLEKERARGEVHNLVYITEQRQGLSQEEAMARVCTAISAETELFLTKEQELLRAFDRHSATLSPYLAGMRTWISGNLAWSRRTERYRSSDHADGTPLRDYLEPELMGVPLDRHGRR